MRQRFGPWQRSLIATSALSVAFLVASLLWQSGYPHWAFLAGFTTIWTTLALAWSNVAYSDESHILLAQIVDQNYHRLHDRLEKLERELDQVRGRRESQQQHIG
jgi:hypothetical protein